MSCSHSAEVDRRLARIEGQVKGVREMVAQGRQCEELLTQLSAVSSAVTQTARVILTEHLTHTVAHGIEEGSSEQTIEDLKRAIDQFAKLK
ncbi:MAG: metal-sensing transcriptional repressor [Oscillospiraceae bacterium]|nr:metal-sensing transcriptional repressor [Oscillospiraceae bacterium]